MRRLKMNLHTYWQPIKESLPTMNVKMFFALTCMNVHYGICKYQGVESMICTTHSSVEPNLQMRGQTSCSSTVVSLSVVKRTKEYFVRFYQKPRHLRKRWDLTSQAKCQNEMSSKIWLIRKYVEKKASLIKKINKQQR